MRFVSIGQVRLEGQCPARDIEDHGPLWTARMLVALHSTFYPQVHFRIDWESEDLNGDAYRQGGQRHVVLLGGLLRASVMGAEGVALVLAHELGHHYSGCPCYPSGISCEGQADYFGVRFIMRRVWGPLYSTICERGIEQISALFDCLAKEEGLSRCDHPPAECRIATYRAALSASPKPACAG